MRNQNENKSEGQGQDEVGNSETGESAIEQTGGGIGSIIAKVFFALLIITIVIVIVVFTFAYFTLVMFKNNPITSGISSILCMLAGNSYIVLISGILELIVTFIPPVAAIVIPILKIFDTYSVACALMSPDTAILTTVFGVIGLLPVGGALGKMAKFYNM